MSSICKRGIALLLVALSVSCLSGGCPAPEPVVPDGPTPPLAMSGKGIVAFLTADDTTLTVGQTTTAHLWVQQSSPSSGHDNGVFSVAVNIEPSAAGIIESRVPVTILPEWDGPLYAISSGIATDAGGITRATVTENFDTTDRTQGLAGPIRVFDFEITAMAAGTVTLRPTNFTGYAMDGIVSWTAQHGDESNYVPVEIIVVE